MTCLYRHLAKFVGFPYEGTVPGEKIETTTFQLCNEPWALWVSTRGGRCGFEFDMTRLVRSVRVG